MHYSKILYADKEHALFLNAHCRPLLVECTLSALSTYNDTEVATETANVFVRFYHRCDYTDYMSKMCNSHAKKYKARYTGCSTIYCVYCLYVCSV